MFVGCVSPSEIVLFSTEQSYIEDIGNGGLALLKRRKQHASTQPNINFNQALLTEHTPLRVLSLQLSHAFYWNGWMDRR